MGVDHCSFRDCKINKNNHPNMNFFKYPVKEEERLKKWVEFSGAEHILNLKRVIQSKCSVCGRHFRDEAFLNYRKDRIWPNQIPTITRISETYAWSYEDLIEGGTPKLIKLKKTTLPHLIGPPGFVCPLGLPPDNDSASTSSATSVTYDRKRSLDQDSYSPSSKKKCCKMEEPESPVFNIINKTFLNKLPAKSSIDDLKIVIANDAVFEIRDIEAEINEQNSSPTKSPIDVKIVFADNAVFDIHDIKAEINEQNSSPTKSSTDDVKIDFADDAVFDIPDIKAEINGQNSSSTKSSIDEVKIDFADNAVLNTRDINAEIKGQNSSPIESAIDDVKIVFAHENSMKIRDTEVEIKGQNTSPTCDRVSVDIKTEPDVELEKLQGSVETHKTLKLNHIKLIKMYDDLQVSHDELQMKCEKLEQKLQLSGNKRTTATAPPAAPTQQLTKLQLFHSIKRYLCTSMTTLVRMEMFGSSEREWKPDERLVSMDLIRLGDNVYKFFLDEWRVRMPSFREVYSWLSKEANTKRNHEEQAEDI